MFRIPELNPNPFWANRYSPSLLDKLKLTNSPPTQSDYNFQALKMWSSLPTKDFEGQQEQYRNSITSFNDSVKSVSSSVKSLTASNFFSQKYVSSSAGTSVTGEAKAGAATAQYNVGVSQVAIGQRNEGTALTANSYGAAKTGISTIGIKVGNGTEKQISVNISATDNNGQALKKFATAINNSGAGVQAEVKTKNNTQYLSITSKDTGAANSFTLRDISGTAMTDLQLDNKVKDAVDAKYTVNGTSYQSASNKVSIDNDNVSLNLNAATTGTITVNVGKDDSKIVDAVKKLVDNYNGLHDILSNSDNVTKRGAKALNSIESFVGKTRSSDFATIGISLDGRTGQLNLDEKKLSDALTSSPDKVKSLLAGNNSLGKAIEYVSKEMANTPVGSYLKPPSAQDNKNYASSYSSNGWMMQQNNLMQGLFLNMTV